MLVLERKDGESIIIQNDKESIEVMFAKDDKGRYRLCVDAPQSYEILRKELIDKWLLTTQSSLLVTSNIDRNWEAVTDQSGH